MFKKKIGGNLLKSFAKFLVEIYTANYNLTRLPNILTVLHPTQF